MQYFKKFVEDQFSELQHELPKIQKHNNVTLDHLSKMDNRFYSTGEKILSVKRDLEKGFKEQNIKLSNLEHSATTLNQVDHDRI